MLPLELADRIEAPPGKILVERVEEPSLSAGGIIKPPRYLAAKLSSEAVVLDVAPEVQGFAVGDRVLLATNVPKPVVFGMHPQKREIYRIFPSSILLRINPALAAGVDHPGRDPLALWEDPLLDTEQRRDEGDPEGLR